MIVGIGLDVVELERIAEIHARHGERFVGRFCRAGECQPRRRAALIEHLGGLFAAKEAVLKALGTGWAQGLALSQVEVVRSAEGAPSIRLHGAAARRRADLGGGRLLVSITHERRYAAAVAILEGPAGTRGGRDA